MFIKFSGRIGDETGSQFTAWLAGLINKHSPEELVILFASSGGSSQSAIEIVSYLRMLTIKITIICTSTAQSAGLHIFLGASTKENRLSVRGGTFLCHENNLSLRERCPLSEIKHRTKIAARILTEHIRHFSECTGVKPDEAKKLFSGHGTYFDTTEAMQSGIIGGVVDDFKLPSGAILHVFAAPPAVKAKPKPK